MNEEIFGGWLVKQGLGPGTVRTQISRLKFIAKHYGDLDAHFLDDELEAILTQLSYSVADEQARAPNPSRLPIGGELRTNLSSYRTTLRKYADFLRDHGAAENDDGLNDVEYETVESAGLEFRFERDLQSAIRTRIEDLEPGLTIVDNGSEYRVSSGFIDILAKDSEGKTVVIELKAVTAKRADLGQIASYMGDLLDDRDEVRGILIAPDFDDKTCSAVRIMPNVKLMRYSLSFTFREAMKQA